ncbi:MAG: CDP-glucose 4,6-dehydratase [[Clostridium] aminophilum]|uniref:CDP-glucose 4,6-dehydratase n=1 Tax=[Clostridium] aminophilum TaxID=1526 RepID=UPI0026EAEFFC|nr:CDP-glucose 4,6-dehydratase [[Clostridium] aminophilum]MDD6196747.1 CDP-glucose 4,6-dehydratase [[Clostridium] aminophilum]
MSMSELFDFYKGKKIFLTGHTGFKGSWLSRILILAGAEVTGYSLEPPTDPSLFAKLGLEKEMHSVTGDVRDLEHLMREMQAAQPEIVLHLAAQPIVRESYQAPVYTYETNVMGTVNILESIRQTPSVRSFVNVTTDKVYLNREWEYGYRENERLDGYDPYSNSKSCSELVTASYRRSFFSDGTRDLTISTCRAGNVIGGGDYAPDRIIPDCIRAAEKKEAIIVRNPYSTRPYQHVLEPLYLYLTAAMRQYQDPSYAGCYNVGPDECDCVTTGEIADLFCRCWGGEMRWENRYVGGPHEANFLKLDCSKAKKTFGWKPKTHIEQAVAMTVEWAQEDRKGSDMRIVTDRQILEFFVS